MEGVDPVEINFSFVVCAVDAGLVETSLFPEQPVVRGGVVSGNETSVGNVGGKVHCHGLSKVSTVVGVGKCVA